MATAWKTVARSTDRATRPGRGLRQCASNPQAITCTHTSKKIQGRIRMGEVHFESAWPYK